MSMAGGKAYLPYGYKTKLVNYSWGLGVLVLYLQSFK